MPEKRHVAVEARNLSVSIGGNHILHGLSFEVDSGVICGLLGANGSGKTTLLKAVGGQIPHGRSLRWHAASTRRPGDVVLGLQSTGYHQKRRTRDHVKFLTLTGLVDEQALDALIDRLDLRKAWNEKPAAMSFGQKQSLNVLGSLAARARLYLLDEPFAGLDARRVTVVRDRIIELRSAGATVIVTSHDLGPIENILETVLVLDAGSLHFSGPKAGFVRHTGDVIVQIGCPDADRLGRALADTDLDQSAISITDDLVTISHPDYREVIARVIQTGVEFDGVVVNSSPLRSALERNLDAYRDESGKVGQL